MNKERDYRSESYVRLVVSWWNKPPLPKKLNVYKIVGGVEFDNGKANFIIEQTGSRTCIDLEQLFSITAVETKLSNG